MKHSVERNIYRTFSKYCKTVLIKLLHWKHISKYSYDSKSKLNEKLNLVLLKIGTIAYVRKFFNVIRLYKFYDDLKKYKIGIKCNILKVNQNHIKLIEIP